MEQPWQQTPNAAPEADDLPLAGLLAELLAASEAGSSAAAEGEALAEALDLPAWAEAGQDAALDAGRALRALDQAAPPGFSGDSSDLQGMLLSRLMENGPDAGGPAGPAAVSGWPEVAEPERDILLPGAEERRETSQPAISAGEAWPGEPAPGMQDSSAALMAGLTGEEFQADTAPAAVSFAGHFEAAPEVMSAAQGDFDPEEPEILVCGEAAYPVAAAAPGELPGAGRTVEEAGPPAEAETGGEARAVAPCASGSPAGMEREPGPGDGADPAGVAGSGEESRLAAPEPAPAPSVGAEAALPMICAGQDAGPGLSGERWSGEARAEEPGSAPSAPAAEPVGAEAARFSPGGASGQPGDEDEFELVDASQAEMMLDRLLDAARTAIHGAPAHRSEYAGPEPDLKPGPAQILPPAGGAAAEESPIQQSVAAAPAPPPAVCEDGLSPQDWPAPAAAQRGESGTREPPAQRRREERQAEASPIPPAVMLMALGLPERLRARLESLGDAERIIQSQTELNAVPAQRPRLLVFRAGGESYALSMESVREVERVSRVTPVPGAPAFLRGLVNLRGEILPLLDLAALLARKGEQSGQRLIVAQAGAADPVVALMVEELNGLAPLQEPDVAQPPQPGPFRGSLDHRGRSVWWLNPAAVFGAEALEKAAAQASAGSSDVRI